jgi:hypothetical protein
MKKIQNSIFEDAVPLHRKESLELISYACESYCNLVKLFHDAEKSVKKDPKRGANLAAMVSEKIFESEITLRILLKELIIGVNHARDTGKMEKCLRNAILDYQSVDGITLFKNQVNVEIEKIKSEFKSCKWLINNHVDLLFKYLKGIDSNGNQLILSIQKNNTNQSICIEPIPRPGSLGRINVKQFFNSVNLVRPPSFILENTCHHLLLTEESKVQLNKPIDLYGAIIANFAFIREYTYWQGRRVAEVGFGAFTGSDPVDVAIALFFIGAAVLLYFGLTTDNEILTRLGLFSAGVGFSLIPGYQVGGAILIGASIFGFVE